MRCVVAKGFPFQSGTFAVDESVFIRRKVTSLSNFVHAIYLCKKILNVLSKIIHAFCKTDWIALSYNTQCLFHLSRKVNLFYISYKINKVILHLSHDIIYWTVNVVNCFNTILSFLQYHVGRRITQRWVLGLINLEQPTKPVFLYVPNRNRRTLTGVISHFIPSGSTIVTDCWSGYNYLTARGYLHLTVNHSRNFVDPNTGKHKL